MDELNNSFGRLSTRAAEWKPKNMRQAPLEDSSSRSSYLLQQPSADEGLQSSSLSTPQSDLNPSMVKEFVPGIGWVSTSPQGAEHEQGVHGSSHVGTEEEVSVGGHHESYEEASIPAGPMPPPVPTYRALHSMSVSDDLWRHYRNMALEGLRQMDPSDPRHKAIPPPYCNAFCLDAHNSNPRSCLGYPSSTFQVASQEDGNLYCLKRFDSVRSVSPKIAAAVSDRWTSQIEILEHPGVVPLVRCFVASRAIFFVHHYIPGARTLKERLEGPLSEPVLWSCITQLVFALRTIHSVNLAARTVRLQHVLGVADVTGMRLRVRLNCLGVVDALEFESRKHIETLQRQDIRDLGRLIVSMATGTEVTSDFDAGALARCEAFLAHHYSRELHNLAMTLIRGTPHPPTIVDVSRAVAQRSMEEQNAVYIQLDQTERALAAEYDSGRAMRLLLKLGFINERPEFGLNRRWSQSGDCYVLSLFRDYVFHQADGAGNPVLDLGHAITALNKLDTADEEKIVLSSRDGKSLMVVSYADVARCLENAFHELCSGAVAPSTLLY